MSDDQVRLDLNGRLHLYPTTRGMRGVVAMDRFRIAQRDLRFPRFIHAFLDRTVACCFLPKMFQLAQGAFHARLR